MLRLDLCPCGHHEARHRHHQPFGCYECREFPCVGMRITKIECTNCTELTQQVETLKEMLGNEQEEHQLYEARCKELEALLEQGLLKEG